MKPKILPTVEPRLESGPVQFGNDLPGVFLRGDYAGPMAFLLRGLLFDVREGRKPNWLELAQIEDLIQTLESADTRRHEK